MKLGFNGFGDANPNWSLGNEFNEHEITYIQHETTQKISGKPPSLVRATQKGASLAQQPNTVSCLDFRGYVTTNPG